MLLDYFGESTSSTCHACDICVGEPEVLSTVDPIRYANTNVVTKQVAASIIGLVREASRQGSIPGRGSFERALQGVARYQDYSIPKVLARSRHFGALAYLSRSEIAEAIDVLLVQRKLNQVECERRDGGTYIGLDVSTSDRP